MTDKTTITLVKPIERKGADPITEVTLHSPSAGALRGMNGLDFMRMDFSATQKIVPRISTPALLPDEIAALGAPDLMQLATAVAGFFMTPDEMNQLQADRAGD